MTGLCLVPLVFMRDKPDVMPTARAQMLSDKIEEYKSGQSVIRVSMPINFNSNLALIAIFFAGLYS